MISIVTNYVTILLWKPSLLFYFYIDSASLTLLILTLERKRKHIHKYDVSFLKCNTEISPLKRDKLRASSSFMVIGGQNSVERGKSIFLPLSTTMRIIQMMSLSETQNWLQTLHFSHSAEHNEADEAVTFSTPTVELINAPLNFFSRINPFDSIPFVSPSVPVSLSEVAM